ncbi:PREDICTED: WD repeat-containing protein WRAP73 [Condylura cristata]|uniref:WD repeat-containing protein WRAP73 n=1 Tax=Condylura cristata TaxID=143302 RepID=UPI0006432675|nr:PREDICTED: WD repeat-containing protein WRAP73 [Condylura cristata]
MAGQPPPRTLEEQPCPKGLVRSADPGGLWRSGQLRPPGPQRCPQQAADRQSLQLAGPAAQLLPGQSAWALDRLRLGPGALSAGERGGKEALTRTLGGPLNQLGECLITNVALGAFLTTGRGDPGPSRVQSWGGGSVSEGQEELEGAGWPESGASVPPSHGQASCVQYRLVVRDAQTLQIVQLYTCLDQVQHVEWSADSLFILCAMYRRGLVQVWSLEQPEWHCRIDEGSAGLVSSCWSPDGRHILNTTDFHGSSELSRASLRLCTGPSSPCPALPGAWGVTSAPLAPSLDTCVDSAAASRRLAFTRDGRYLALAERRDCRDYVSVLVCSGWQLLRHFDTDTQDLAGIEWAPNGCVLAAWDSCLEYKILLYSLDGRLLSTYSAYEWSLGIKAVAWSPSSQFLAVGSYDGKVRILNHVTWKVLAELGHPATVTDPKVVVYQEAEKSPRPPLGRHPFPPPPGRRSAATESKFEVASVPVSLQALKPVTDRANPKIGIGALAFSPDNYFLATRNDNVPNAVWIWDVRKLRLAVVLEQQAPVRAFQWDPRRPRLAVCTGGSKVYLWSPAGCLSVQVPGEGDFQVLSLGWHCRGDALALLSRDHFCLCFLEGQEGVGAAMGQQGGHA